MSSNFSISLGGLSLGRVPSHQYMMIRDFRRDRKYTSWAVISRVKDSGRWRLQAHG